MVAYNAYVITTAVLMLLSSTAFSSKAVAQTEDSDALEVASLADLKHAPEDPQTRLTWIDERIQVLQDERPTPRAGRIMLIAGAASTGVGLGLGIVGLFGTIRPLRAADSPEDRESTTGSVLLGTGGVLIGCGLLSLVAGGLAKIDARYRANRHDDAVSLLRQERELWQRRLSLSVVAYRREYMLSWGMRL